MNATAIRDAISAAGGLESFSSKIRKERNPRRPMKRMMIDDLQSLTTEELNVAFHLGLIGNARQDGTIIKNAHR